MKLLWCWRCKKEAIMLDEEEYERIHEKFSAGILAVQNYRKNSSLSIKDIQIKDFMFSVCEEYKAITGVTESEYTTILHHRISRLGPQCTECGKPYRTPKAFFCAECGPSIKD